MLCEKIHIEFGDVCSYATEKILEIQQAVHQALLKIQENILQVIGRIEALIQTLNNTSTRLNQDKDLTPNKIELMTQENKDMLCFGLIMQLFFKQIQDLLPYKLEDMRNLMPMVEKEIGDANARIAEIQAANQRALQEFGLQ